MKQSLIILVLILITIPFLLPFFKSSYFETDDGVWAIVRQSSLHNEIRQGQFPVRWSGSLNFGYGYPLFNFSYPGPYYFGEIFKLFHINDMWSVKLTFITATIASVIGMYFFSKELWKSELAGIIAALFYLTGPYRVLNTFIRGSLGELVAAALFPFICYCGIRLLTTGKRRYIIAGAFLLAALIISHNVMALLFIPFFILLIIGEIFLKYVKFSELIRNYIEEFQNRKKGFKDNFDKKLFLNHIHLIIVMLLLGIGLSAFFWLPALAEVKYTKLAVTPLTNIAREFENTQGLFVTPFDTRATQDPVQRNNFIRGMNYVHIAVLFTVLLIILFYRKDYKMATHRILLYLCGYLIALELLTPSSEVLWRNLPGLQMIDFPWRMYGILAFIRPIIIGAIALIPRVRYVGIILAIIPFFFFPHDVSKLRYTTYSNDYYATNQATTTSANEYLNKWMKTPVSQNTPSFITPSDVNNQEFTSTIRKNTSTAKKITYTSSSEQEIEMAIMYFPGWQIRLDGRPHGFDYQNSNGIIRTKVPAGSHTLEAVFQDTPVRYAGNIISLTTGIALIVIFSVQYIRGKRFIV